MRDIELYTTVLGIAPPWVISDAADRTGRSRADSCREGPEGGDVFAVGPDGVGVYESLGHRRGDRLRWSTNHRMNAG